MSTSETCALGHAGRRKGCCYCEAVDEPEPDCPACYNSGVVFGIEGDERSCPCGRGKPINRCRHCSESIIDGESFCGKGCEEDWAASCAKPSKTYDAQSVTIKFAGQQIGPDAFEGIFSKPDDMINAPPHYTAGDIESIDYIEDQGHGRGFCYGNALKYLARAPHKGCERSDLLKAIWYVERLIAQLGGDVGG